MSKLSKAKAKLHQQDEGAFIIPQMSAPFEYSGCPSFKERRSEAYEKFTKQTGIVLRNNIGIDTEHYADDWHGVSPKVEIVVADFREAVGQTDVKPAETEEQLAMFGSAA